MVTDDSGECSASVLMVKLAKRKEALRSATLVAIYKSTRCNTPELSNFRHVFREVILSMRSLTVMD